jgi:excisionase family DNA binding protein
MTRYLAIREVADRWSVVPQTVRMRIASGELVAVKVGRVFRVSLAAVEDYEARYTSPLPMVQ